MKEYLWFGFSLIAGALSGLFGYLQAKEEHKKSVLMAEVARRLSKGEEKSIK